ncbi:hypothetical protein Plhal304r1_c051g0133851 [Plasmopara halstedii]
MPLLKEYLHRESSHCVHYHIAQHPCVKGVVFVIEIQSVRSPKFSLMETVTVT